MLFGAALTALTAPLLALFRFIPLTYNEGWNAFWADAAMSHRELYGADNQLVSNNYPPLSFDLVGAIGRIIGDNVIAGRLVSLASLFVMLAASYVWLRAVGMQRQVALVGTAFLLAVFAFFGSKYVAMNDPQMLAHAFMLLGAVALWRGNFSVASVILAAVLMLMGGFTKHLLLPLPLAATLVIALFRRERLTLWLACFAVGVPLGFLFTSHFHGPFFLQDLLSPRAYVPERGLRTTIHVVTRFVPLIALALIPLVQRLRSTRQSLGAHEWFGLFYVASSIVVGGIAAGGDGVTRNAFFDLLIALSLAAAMGLAAWRSAAATLPALRTSSSTRAVVLIGVGMAAYAAVSLPAHLREIRELDALEKDTQATVQTIARLGDGRAACETLALCYWARNAFTVDFFNYGQKLKTGMLPVADCTRALERGEYPVVQLDPREHRFGYRLQSCAPAVERFYRVAYRSRVATLYVPKAVLVAKASGVAR